MSQLAEAVRRAAAALGDAHLASLSSAFEGQANCGPGALAATRSAVPAVHHDVVDRIHRAWTSRPSLAGAAVALALESARLSAKRPDLPRVEVVVTGPDSPAVAIRLTSAVVIGLIDAATSRVTIVSYSVSHVAPVLKALTAAQHRGVKVQLIFESPEHFNDGGGAHLYSAHPTYHWPADARPPHAVMHAKAVIIDERDILVTSANLSNLAQQSSVELGLLCRGGGVANQVQRHFDALVGAGVLVPNE